MESVPIILNNTCSVNVARNITCMSNFGFEFSMKKPFAIQIHYNKKKNIFFCHDYVICLFTIYQPASDSLHHPKIRKKNSRV